MDEEQEEMENGYMDWLYPLLLYSLSELSIFVSELEPALDWHLHLVRYARLDGWNMDVYTQLTQ